MGLGQGHATTSHAAPERGWEGSNSQSRKRSERQAQDALQGPDLLDERPLKKVHVAPEAGNTQQACKRSLPQDLNAESVAEATRPSSRPSSEAE